MNQGESVELDSHVKKLIWIHNVEMAIVENLHNGNKTQRNCGQIKINSYRR